MDSYRRGIDTADWNVRLSKIDELILTPMFGFKSVLDYYKASTVTGKLHNITCPTMYIGALDDPINTPEVFPVEECEKNPNLLLASTTYGGHCCHITHRKSGPGFLGKLNWLFPASEWYAEPISEFFACLERNNKIDD